MRLITIDNDFDYLKFPPDSSQLYQFADLLAIVILAIGKSFLSLFRRAT